MGFATLSHLWVSSLGNGLITFGECKVYNEVRFKVFLWIPIYYKFTLSRSHGGLSNSTPRFKIVLCAPSWSILSLESFWRKVWRTKSVPTISGVEVEFSLENWRFENIKEISLSCFHFWISMVLSDLASWAMEFRDGIYRYWRKKVLKLFSSSTIFLECFSKFFFWFLWFLWNSKLKRPFSIKFLLNSLLDWILGTPLV